MIETEAEIERTLVGMANHAYARVTQLEEVLQECAEYFDDRADVLDSDENNSLPRPNREMQLLQRIKSVL